MFPDENEVTKTRHPPYSLDLAPSGFFLLGHVKQLLQGGELLDWDSLFNTIVQILTGLEKVSLNDVVLFWMDRVGSCAVTH
jgi:hypothetical protein